MNDPVNKVNEVKKYEFKLLRGEAVGEDAFEDKTHEKIADSLAQLIKNEEKGITIGLEGSWGSGKSTVISILRKKLKEGRSSIPLIQFDAWAHEGDPLRRIFLESLIDEISSVYNLITDSLKEKKEEISKHRVVKNINTKQATTIFGTFFALSFALIPLGISLIDKTDFSKLSTSGNLYLIFIIGIIFTALPILPIFI
ncbi:MAG TPA: P-loop NTPase fold protein, partial [Spirochaetota bacterium]|nr:P-loop NTPase fold protein [Spirochaetota bacterium]